MILKGSQRGSARQLARHLLNTRDNDHITLHELRGFSSGSLAGAFKEIQAVARGTRCEQALFSLSLNPPETEIVSAEVFEKAIAAIEQKLGLDGQPRAIIFHEKKGRRHAHCVWSRIDAQNMTAINLPHFKRKLQDIARDLYREHRWQMPAGFNKTAEHDQNSYTQGQAQQASRVAKDPATLKALFRHCWERSDSRGAFEAALRERGFILAKGDRRGFVAVDRHGEIYSISRWVGVKAKDVRAKLGDRAGLPSVEEAKTRFDSVTDEELSHEVSDLELAFKQKRFEFEAARRELFLRQKKVRDDLHETQKDVLSALIFQQQASLPRGMRGVWLKFSGGLEKLRHDHAESLDQERARHRTRWQKLVVSQLQERRVLEQRWQRLLADHRIALDQLDCEVGNELKQLDELPFLDPAQPLILMPSEEELEAAARIRRNPETVIDVINDKKEYFKKSDIARELAKHIGDSSQYRDILTQVMSSKKLVAVDDEGRLTTQDMLNAKNNLRSQLNALADNSGFRVSNNEIKTAIDRKNKALHREVGAFLSEEQKEAITHILQPRQLSVVVGLAGAGKSTMLEAARDAWERQGYQVIGAALSGKAADGLESSSGIKSRTLASLLHSIDQGVNPLSPNSVLVIDEAGMVGTRQMERVVSSAKQAGAKLVLVGDPDQLQPIQAGRPFKEIVDTMPTARLR